ncbi:hypothetical protein AC579_7835 [Pseudocercospora musae]|uniref:DNA-directed RNA polymerase III subunit RPC9 n=1 Tax=Pseudocercospora musae TaxID=113226 RepID=A0A139HA31_9PEZI|nr:hypothetical protein AC579_7835 [Pseudocercospora musae]
MKVLDAGDHPLSNADVLDWIKRKRAQHAAEDAEDKAKAPKSKKDFIPTQRPKNFMRILDRTERELGSEKYPYTKNPSAYSSDARKSTFQTFVLEAENVIQDALQDEWREKLQGMTREEIDREFEPVQEMKCLTMPEMLMVYNHAPQCVEMLQPMIENCEERFSAEEQQMLVDVVIRVLRPDEVRSEG